MKIVNILVKFIPRDLIDNKSALIRLMALCRICDKHYPDQPVSSSSMWDTLILLRIKARG